MSIVAAPSISTTPVAQGTENLVTTDSNSIDAAGQQDVPAQDLAPDAPAAPPDGTPVTRSKSLPPDSALPPNIALQISPATRPAQNDPSALMDEAHATQAPNRDFEMFDTAAKGGKPEGTIGSEDAAILAQRVAGTQRPDSVAKSVNPTNSTQNCGFIIDAVVARLRGTDPNATAPDRRDGSFSDIEKRMGTAIKWNQSLQAAFDQVQAGGPGTIGVMGIEHDGSSHVVIIANVGGKVGIIEGQNWGAGQPAGMIYSVAAANARYNPDGRSNIGFGILPNK